jgi:hypothetical protein
MSRHRKPGIRKKWDTGMRLACDHVFHIAHVNGRTIPGVMVCEVCGQHLILRPRTSPPDRK